MTKYLFILALAIAAAYLGALRHLATSALALVPAAIFMLNRKFPENRVLKFLLTDWGGIYDYSIVESTRCWHLSLKYLCAALFLALLSYSLLDLSDPIEAAGKNAILGFLDIVLLMSPLAAIIFGFLSACYITRYIYLALIGR